MDKPLPEKDQEKSAPEATSAASSPDYSKSTIGAYGAPSLPPLSTDEYEKSKAPPWLEQGPGHRLAIRAFSRGVLGALFFHTGTLLNRKWMGMGKSATMYDASKPLLEQLPSRGGNPLRVLAKIIDNVAGKPIKFVFGENAVTFKPTEFVRKNYAGEIIRGCTLGEEMVNVTFNFFSMSIGDAMGRDIVGWFDPNAQRTWKDEQGHIKFPEAVKSLGKAAWRYASYNGGEDWAVALPYVYFMKGQRNLMNKLSPGFANDFDRGLNGASFKIGGRPLLPDGRANMHYRPIITGNYNIEGAMDLQTRFTFYNVGTLMYREFYDHMEHILQGKNDHLYGAADPDPNRGPLGYLGDVAKWTGRSVVKGLICMTPAVPFFWFMRMPQFKDRGVFTHPKYGTMAWTKDGGMHHAVHASDIRHENMPKDAPVHFYQYTPDASLPWNQQFKHTDSLPSTANPANYLDPTKIQNKGKEGYFFHPYHMGANPVEKLFDKTAQVQHKIADSLHGPAEWLDKAGGEGGRKFKSLLGMKADNKWGTQSWTRFTHPTIRAGLAYYPYMWAKGETALMWDTGKMDMSAERMIDGATALNWGEFKAGAGEVWNTFLHRPLSNAARETEGERRNELGRAAPDIFDETQGQMELRYGKDKNRDWRSRVVSGQSEAQEKSGESEFGNRYKTSPRQPYSVAEHKPQSHAAHEEMRQFLSDVVPPTNSKH